MTPEQKHQKTQLKTLWKKCLKAHAHIIILQSETGKISMFTNMADSKDVAYTLTYMANDLMGSLESFEKEVQDKVGEAMKEREDKDINDAAEQFKKEGKID